MQQIFGITKEIEANENVLRFLQSESEKLPKPEAELDTFRHRKNEAKQCNTSLERELKACKRQLEIVEKERDELLIKKSRFDQQDILMEEAEKWITSLSQDFKVQYNAAKTEINKLETSKAELVQQLEAGHRKLKVALTEIDELKISHEEMSCQLKVHKRKLKVTESERYELKAAIIQAKKRNVELENLKSEAEQHVTNLSEQLEASEMNIKMSAVEKYLLEENISLLKQQGWVLFI